MDPDSEKAYAERPSATVDAWQGTEPAEGTRRALIRNVLRIALRDKWAPDGIEPGFCKRFSLELADAVDPEFLVQTKSSPSGVRPSPSACLSPSGALPSAIGHEKRVRPPSRTSSRWARLEIRIIGALELRASPRKRR